MCSAAITAAGLCVVLIVEQHAPGLRWSLVWSGGDEHETAVHAKAALAILQHAHGWVAKQPISVEVDQRISVIDALRAAEQRTIEGQVTEIIETQLSIPANAEAHLQSR